MTSRTEVDARLRARARELARPIKKQQSRGADHLLAVIGAVRIAIPVVGLRQTVAPGPVTRLPGLPQELLGIRPLRGDIVCIADLAELLGSPASAEPAAQHVVVLEGASPLGLLVDEVLGLQHLDPAEVHPPPTSTAATATLPSALAGVTADGVLVVDTASLLADPRLRLSASPDSTKDDRD